MQPLDAAADGLFWNETRQPFYPKAFFYALHFHRQQHERMDRVALSMMIKGPLSLVALGAAIYLSGDLLLGVCGLAAAWLPLLLVYDARNGASLLKVASGAKHPAVDFRRWDRS